MYNLVKAELKDDVLKHLRTKKGKQTGVVPTYNAIGAKEKDVPVSVFVSYLKDMKQDEVIVLFMTASPNGSMKLTEYGERFLNEGGYTKQTQDEADRIKQAEEDAEQERKERALSIQTLEFQVKDYKWTKIRSKIALLISIVAVSVSLASILIPSCAK